MKKENAYDLSTISGRLQSIRKTAGLTQEALAELLGVDPTTINRYENGARLPSLENLCRYSKKCNVSTDYILFGTAASAPMPQLPPALAASILEFADQIRAFQSGRAD